TGTTADGARSLYVFRSLDAFQRGEADSIRQTFGGSDVDIVSQRTGAFIQDHWTAAAGLTIDAGIRFDATALTPSLGITSRQLSPRAGLAWMPAHDWVIRAGAGTFADRLVLASFERAWLAAYRGGFEQIAVAPAAFGSVAPSTYTIQAGPWDPRRL